MSTARALAILVLGAVLAAAATAPSPVAAAGPGSAGLPPLIADGPVRLPNGRVLPVNPAGQARSVMAQMLAQHAHDQLHFSPGAQPAPRNGPAVSGLSAWTGGDSRVVLVPLASTTAPTMTTASASSLPNGLRKEVFGFLPYWMLDATDLQWMQYGLVSTIAYFGVAARSDGTLVTSGSTWGGWTSSAMTSVTNAAHAKGVKVVLTVTMMAWDSASSAAQATLLGNATAQATLISQIVATVRARAADGVNLDFEPVATSQRDRFTSFVRNVKAGLVAAGVGSYLTVDTMAGAATWSTGYDVAGLTANGAADALFVMGYDYSWSGSSRAGGVAPMSSSYMLDVNESASDYLSLTSGSKLIWGVPYYGRTWPTTSNALNALTASGAASSSVAYYYIGSKSQAAKYGRKWDSLGQVPWYAYQDPTSGSWVEGYYDDPFSLGAKYDMINQRGMAGVGIWHLLMDAGTSELWNLIAAKFQNDTSPPIGGIADMPAATDSYVIPVSWRATDPGSGVASYTVQVRDRADGTWTTWLRGTSASGSSYVGIAGHTYEFRVSAVDGKGNAQPWQPIAPDPSAGLAVGQFASVLVDSLNVRAGAGTTFAILAKQPRGSVVKLLAGPISGSGYTWYQVQFDFSEWPSADYPRMGWVATGDSSGPYLQAVIAPSVTTIAPAIGSYHVQTPTFSPNGDGHGDTTSVTYVLPAPASDVRLDVVDAWGSVVDAVDLGAQAAGGNSATWDGRFASGAWASPGSYLLRLTVADLSGTHVAPAADTSWPVRAAWGVFTDFTAPTIVSQQPSGGSVASTGTTVRARFSESVVGVNQSTMTLTDLSTGSPVAAGVSYDSSTLSATLSPDVQLVGGHTYRVSISGAIRDLAGNSIGQNTWTFATATPGITTYDPPARITFRAGTVTGYKFDAGGNVLSTLTATLSRTSGASASQRSKAVPGQIGAFYAIVNGIWAGYWVRESPSVYLPGVDEQIDYASLQHVAFSAGTYTGYRFDSAGNVIGALRYSLPRASGASAQSWAIINGRPYVAIVNGIWAGYWMPLGGGVTLS